MRMILSMLLAAALFTSCGAQSSGNKKGQENSAKQSEKATTIHITEADFIAKVIDFRQDPEQWKYLGDKPAIVDFYADWCPPCRKIAPILEELAAEYGDRIRIYKVNTDEEQELATAFGIQSIPTLFFIPMQGQFRVAEGAMPKSEFKELIENVLLAQ